MRSRPGTDPEQNACDEMVSSPSVSRQLGQYWAVGSRDWRRYGRFQLSKANVSVGLGVSLLLAAIAGSEASVSGVQLVKGVPLWVQILIGAVGVALILWALAATREPVPELWTQQGFLGVAPRIPARFVERPGLSEAVVTALAASAQTVALTGMGGAGKSILAAHVCHDSRIQERFRDGVTWLEAGSGRDPVSLLADLGRRLGLPETTLGFTTLSHGRDRLAAALRERHVLVVLDNVWERDPLDAVTGLAPTCTVLFTTRLPETATTFAAAQIRVDELTPEQAIALLEQWTGPGAARTLPDARRLCARVGNLALGVAMAGAMVAQGRSIGDVLALIDDDLARVRADMDPQYPYRTLFAAIEAGISSLPDADQERYEQMAVFARQGPFPRDAARMLWQVQDADPGAGDLLAELTGRSLLTATDDGWYMVHDAQSEVLARRLGPDGLAAAHRLLVEGYRSRFPGGWADSAGDPYLSQSLASHLSQAGCVQELDELLMDAGWIAARVAAGQLLGLLADYGYSADPRCREIARALRLSAHALAADPTLVRGQLANRLQGNPDPAVAAWAAHMASSDAAGPWLMPVTPALTPTTTALRQVLTGHGRWVLSVAVDYEGRTAVSGGTDGLVRTWDLTAGRQLSMLAGKSYSPVSAVAVTADAMIAVSGHQDGQLRIWDLSGGQPRAVLGAHAGAVSSLSVAQDAKVMLSGGDDGLVRLWDLRSHQEKAVLAGHADGVRAVALSADGTVGVSAGRDGALLVWDLSNGTATATLTGHDGPVLAVAIDPAAKIAVTGGSDATVRVWDLGASRQEAVFTGHSGGVLAAAVSGDGATAVTGGSDGSVRCWDLAGRRQATTLTGHDGWVRSVAVSAVGRLAVSGGGDGTVRVWDLEAEADPGTRADADKGAAWAAAVAAEAGFAVADRGDNSIQVWDLVAGREVATVPRSGGAASSLAVTSNCELSLTGDGDGHIRAWNLTDRREQAVLPGHEGWAWPVVAVTPDGKLAISGGGDGTVRVWDLPAGYETTALNGHDGGISAVAAAADGTLAVSGGEDGTLRVWDLTGRRERTVLKGHVGSLLSLAVTPDGTLAASGGSDNDVRIWDLTAHREICILAGHNSPVRAIAVTDDGTIAVSGGEDGSIRAWNLSIGAEIARWTGDYAVLACAVLPGHPIRVAVVQRRRNPYLLELRSHHLSMARSGRRI